MSALAEQKKIRQAVRNLQEHLSEVSVLEENFVKFVEDLFTPQQLEDVAVERAARAHCGHYGCGNPPVVVEKETQKWVVHFGSRQVVDAELGASFCSAICFNRFLGLQDRLSTESSHLRQRKEEAEDVMSLFQKDDRDTRVAALLEEQIYEERKENVMNLLRKRKIDSPNGVDIKKRTDRIRPVAPAGPGGHRKVIERFPAELEEDPKRDDSNDDNERSSPRFNEEEPPIQSIKKSVSFSKPPTAPRRRTPEAVSKPDELATATSLAMFLSDEDADDDEWRGWSSDASSSEEG